MKNIRRYLIPALLLCVYWLSAIDIENGRMALSLNERYGTFAISYLEDPTKRTYRSLLFPEDARTTYFSLVINNQVFTPAGSSEFKQNLVERGSGARFVWTSKEVEVLQDFRFLRSTDSAVSNGLEIAFTIRNISGRRLSIGLRYLLDSYLGEDDNYHFATEFIKPVTSELELTPPLPDYFLSPVKGADDKGLMVMLDSFGLTRPDSVVFANWKRLNDSSWSYTVNRSRNFSRPPYSINDSAAALYYNPQPMEPGQERRIVLALGYFAAGGFSPDAGRRDEKIENLVESLSDGSNEAGKGGPENELEAVRELLAEIDLLIESGEDVPEEKIYLLRQLMEALQKRKSSFRQ
jgi:hypothetical protein